jgi:PAS domain-containing protein
MFYHFEGVLEQLPCTLGLPRARLVESRVTERDMDSLFELPPSSTALERLADLARRARGAASPGDVAAAYEAQRRELTAGLDAMRTETLEIKRLFADLPDLVLVHRGGSILWMNPALIEALGYADGAALVGRPVLEIVAEDFRANVAQRLDGSAEGPPPRTIGGKDAGPAAAPSRWRCRRAATSCSAARRRGWSWRATSPSARGSGSASPSPTAWRRSACSPPASRTRSTTPSDTC